MHQPLSAPPPPSPADRWQVFSKPFDAPAILVVGHQTDGKSGGCHETHAHGHLVGWGGERVWCTAQPGLRVQLVRTLGGMMGLTLGAGGRKGSHVRQTDEKSGALAWANGSCDRIPKLIGAERPPNSAGLPGHKRRLGCADCAALHSKDSGTQSQPSHTVCLSCLGTLRHHAVQRRAVPCVAMPAALVEALMGFQFNSVGGGTKTRRPITLHMAYSAAAVQPVCYLVTDDLQEQEVALEELQVKGGGRSVGWLASGWVRRTTAKSNNALEVQER